MILHALLIAESPIGKAVSLVLMGAIVVVTYRTWKKVGDA